MTDPTYALLVGMSAAVVAMTTMIPTNMAIDIVEEVAKDYRSKQATPEHVIEIIERSIGLAVFRGTMGSPGSDNQSTEYDGGTEEVPPPSVR